MKKNKIVEISPEVKNIRELVEFSSQKYANNVAYKYKKDMNQKPVEYIEKTYEDVDISNLLTSEFVSEGEEVEKGQTIGTVGESASFEVLDDSHLHFEIYRDGEVLNPTIYMK